jgi:TorA maturation chaperone TorD
MANALQKHSDEELSIEYAKLFVGPFELKAPPYGSVYLEKERRVMGDSTMEVLQMYQQAGLTIKENFKELPDHITVELEFMYYLIFREIEFINTSKYDEAAKCLEKQNIFLHQYLGQWMWEFCEKIKGGTDNEFYQSLGECVLNFVNGERKYINSLSKELQRQSVKGP